MVIGSKMTKCPRCCHIFEIKSNYKRHIKAAKCKVTPLIGENVTHASLWSAFNDCGINDFPCHVCGKMFVSLKKQVIHTSQTKCSEKTNWVGLDVLIPCGEENIEHITSDMKFMEYLTLDIKYEGVAALFQKIHCDHMFPRHHSVGKCRKSFGGCKIWKSTGWHGCEIDSLSTLMVDRALQLCNRFHTMTSTSERIDERSLPSAVHADRRSGMCNDAEAMKLLDHKAKQRINEQIKTIIVAFAATQSGQV